MRFTPGLMSFEAIFLRMIASSIDFVQIRALLFLASVRCLVRVFGGICLVHEMPLGQVIFMEVEDLHSHHLVVVLCFPNVVVALFTTLLSLATEYQLLHLLCVRGTYLLLYLQSAQSAHGERSSTSYP